MVERVQTMSYVIMTSNYFVVS